MLSKWDEPTFGEMIANQARMPLCSSPNTASLVRAYRTGEEKARHTAVELQQTLDQVGSRRPWDLPTDIVPSEIGGLERDEARRELGSRHQALLERIEGLFQRDLEDASAANLIGRIEWLGERACRFHYFEREKSRTLTKIHTRTVKHTHDLVDARKVRLPAHRVKKPRKCREIIKAMPAWMAKHAYIVTGTQIVANVEQVAEQERPNELVRAGQWVRRSTKAVWDRADAAASVPVGRFTAILRDPALVIGNYVLTGWEE